MSTGSVKGRKSAEFCGHIQPEEVVTGLGVEKSPEMVSAGVLSDTADCEARARMKSSYCVFGLSGVNVCVFPAQKRN